MSRTVPEHLQKTAKGEAVTMLEAISEGLYEEMVRDDSIFMMGEDISGRMVGPSRSLVASWRSSGTAA